MTTLDVKALEYAIYAITESQKGSTSTPCGLRYPSENEFCTCLIHCDPSKRLNLLRSQVTEPLLTYSLDGTLSSSAKCI